MTRSQLLFVILLNAIISFAIALAVAWIVDARRPDPEQLAASFTPTPALAVLVETLPATQDANGAATQGQPQPPTATDTPAPSGQTIDYVVQSGDTLAVIAAKHGSTQDAIIKANSISDPNLLYVGTHLAIPIGNSSSSPAVATTPAPPTGAGLRISQVIAVGDLANEAVEIVNDGNQAYSLQGWRLQKEGGPEYTFADVQLFQGAGLKVFSASGADNSISRYWNQTAALWQSGTVIKLINSQGNVVTTFTVQ